MLNRLKSTLTSGVSQLSGVLPGNPVTREFEVNKQICSAGPGLLWKVYDGYKKSTKQPAAIFVLEKKQLDEYGRQDRDVLLELLKKGVNQLTRLRHPQVLTVQHPLEESRESLAFATEPVMASLANVIGPEDSRPSQLRNFKLFPVEIQYGLLQLSEGLSFLHTSVKMLHRNVCPHSIVINSSGAWKIAGFDFSVMSQSEDGQTPYWPFYEYQPHLHPCCQPDLNYLAPEYALTMSYDSASDMFSLGALAYSLFSGGKPLLPNVSDWHSFKREADNMKRQLYLQQLTCAPEELREHLKLLLNPMAEIRPDAHQLSKIPYFEDVGVKTLSYLDSLYQWDNLQKSQFYKGLPQILPKLPHRVSLLRIVPCLVKESVNRAMVPFVLPSIFHVAQEATKEEYVEHILPYLRPITKMTEPIQILLILMQNIELMLSKTPVQDAKTFILPLLYRALETDAQAIQELVLNIIPSSASLIDFPSMKNHLLPRIKQLCLRTPLLSVRVNTLVCLGKLLEHLDRWLVMDEVLPLMRQINSREPAVLMGMLGIYKLALEHPKLGITKDKLATDVLPFLMPLMIENGLTLKQFNALTTLVGEMVKRVESEQRVKIEQLDAMQEQQRSALHMTLTAPKSDELIAGVTKKPTSQVEDMFSGLGLEGYVADDQTSKAASLLNGHTPDKRSTNAAASTPKATLSMEEKQRLAWQQETQQKMKSQSPLQPTASMTATSPTGPQRNVISSSGPVTKDLTSQLINSNLTMMGHKQPQPSPMSSTFQTSPAPAAFQPMGTAPAGIMPLQQGTPQPMRPMGGFQSPSGAFSPQFSQSPMNTVQRTPNSLNFGNMSPMSMMHTASPMNIMQPQRTTLMSPTQNASKTLSSSEINDFLS